MATVVGWDKSVTKKCTCRNCGAIVEYLKAEIQEYHGKDYSGGPDGRTWIVCPNCSDTIILTSW